MAIYDKRTGAEIELLGFDMHTGKIRFIPKDVDADPGPFKIRLSDIKADGGRQEIGDALEEVCE